MSIDLSNKRPHWTVGLALLLTACVGAADRPECDQLACAALVDMTHLTITSATLRAYDEGEPSYCHVRGMSAGIRFHVQLPLTEHWNGRFLMHGDGGWDGGLNFANERVAQGYAVANSNSGHDGAAEPGASFGFNNRQSEIDFGYRAVHLTVNAAKRIAGAFYGRAPEFSYFEGCSTGGRQGLMEAQRYPYDFDGIVAEGPVNFLQAMAANNIWTFQRMYSDDFAGNLAFDTDGDGVPDSLTKLTMLAEAVLAKCDERDGFTDRVIDDPLSCDFDPRADLSAMMCPGDVDADDCFTAAQLQTIEDVYRGAYDSNGTVIYKGKSFGSESGWARWIVPHQGNNLNPWFFALYATYANYLFYESDPGVPPATLTDPTVTLDKARTPPEWAWWEFDVDDVTSGAGDVMASIFDSADPDLAPYLLESDGKLILIHGWMDAGPNPEPTLDYYNAVVESTFDGDVDEARSRARLFMAPGMGHCGGGPGPNSWDKLAPLVDWVESGIVPDHVVATHTTDGVVDNERKICAYPDQAVYVGPEGGQNDPANWIESNFACEAAR